MNYCRIEKNNTVVVLGRPTVCAKSRKEYAEKYLKGYSRVFLGWNQAAKDSVESGHSLVVITDSMDNKQESKLYSRYHCITYTMLTWKEYNDRKLAKRFITQIAEENKRASEKFEDNGDIILTLNIDDFNQGLTSAMVKVLDHFSDMAFVTVYVKLSDMTKISRTIKIYFCEYYAEFKSRLNNAILDGYKEALSK